jgi:predicted dienelactone hydrolase
LGKSHLAQRVDTSRVIAAGHSYGANTTLLVAGARVPRKGVLVDTRDHRVHAAILISAPRFYGEGNFQEILASVDVPSLHITATGDDIRLPGFYSGVEDRLDIFTATGSKNKWLAIFNGGSHSMFTDRSTTGGLFLNPQVKMATRSLSLAFVHHILHGNESALRAWQVQYTDILSEFRTPALSQGPL